MQVNEAYIGSLENGKTHVEKGTDGSVVSRLHSQVMGEEEDGPPERQTWGGQLEFILTCVGFAVGLGNVWRFPYLAYENGGGAFLIPYVLMLLIIGFPMFFMEVSIGQFTSLTPTTIYAVSPAFKGVGIASVIVTAIITWYYNVIIAWILFYFFASMNSDVPWASCNNWWNTENCIEAGTNSSQLIPNETYYTSSEEYYYRYVLQLPGDDVGIGPLGDIRWQLVLCLLLSWVIIFLVLLKGIESLGKASYFVSLFPYVLLTIMLVRGVTLPGSADGIKFYITPEWSKILEAKVWSDAATQIFYSLGISMGSLIAMASFNNFNNNILRDAMIIPFVNCGTSIYAGFVIFSVLGYMANEKGVPISEVAAEGPGLIFVVYPEGLATMPAAPLWSVLFFFMMTTLGFSSQFSTAEGVIAAFCDEFPDTLRVGRRPMYLRLVLCICFFLLALPMVCQGGFYLFTVVNAYSGSYTLLLIAFFEILVFQYIYGFDRISEDFALMLGKKPSTFFFVMWKIITPLVVVFVFLITCLNYTPSSFNGVQFPAWLDGIGWLLVAIPITVIAVVFVWTFFERGGYQVLKSVTSPEPSWGPAKPRDRTGRYMVPTVAHIQMSDFTFKPNPTEELNVNKLEESVAFEYEGYKVPGKMVDPVYAEIRKSTKTPSNTDSAIDDDKRTDSNKDSRSAGSPSSVGLADTAQVPVVPEKCLGEEPGLSPPQPSLTDSSLETIPPPAFDDASSVGSFEIQTVHVDFHASSDASDDKEEPLEDSGDEKVTTL